MTTKILIPVKSLKYGKSRLTGSLPESQRIRLNEFLLLHTLNIIQDTSIPMKDVVVISRDEDILSIARRMGMQYLLEIGEGGLNNALYQANNRLDQEMDNVLVLPTDLPLMTSSEVTQVLEFAGRTPIVVVAPDRHELGTNALLVSPVGAIPYRFGNHSFSKHMNAAKKRGVPVEAIRTPGFAIDLDVMEDLELLKARGFIIPVIAINSMKETVL